MYENFGEFDSAEEINQQAELLFNCGDRSGLYRLAAENGIPREAADAYADCETDVLCDVYDAALGKIDVEASDLGCEEILEDWAEYVKACIMDSEQLARNVRKREYSLKGCIAKLLIWSIQHMEPVDQEIIQEAKKAVKKQDIKIKGFQINYLDRTALGIPGMARAKRMIRAYYCGEEDEQ